MITYYIGNVRVKRKMFREKRENSAEADNPDVLADFMLNGKVCFVLGDIPFSDMRVGEYLAYARALKTRLPLSASGAKELLRRVGVKIPLWRKMAQLTRLQFRFVLLAAAYNDDTRQVWLNLDGIAYSAFTRISARKMLSALERGFGEVHVSVSDYRFIPRKANAVAVTNCGTAVGISKSVSRKYARMHFNREKRKSSLALSTLNGRKTLLCDN